MKIVKIVNNRMAETDLVSYIGNHVVFPCVTNPNPAIGPWLFTEGSH